LFFSLYGECIQSVASCQAFILIVFSLSHDLSAIVEHKFDEEIWKGAENNFSEMVIAMKLD